MDRDPEQLGTAAPRARGADPLRSRANDLPPEARTAIGAHIATCRSCRDELRALRAFDPRTVASGGERAKPRRRWWRGVGRLVLHPAIAYGIALAFAIPVLFSAVGRRLGSVIPVMSAYHHEQKPAAVPAHPSSDRLESTTAPTLADKPASPAYEAEGDAGPALRRHPRPHPIRWPWRNRPPRPSDAATLHRSTRPRVRRHTATSGRWWCSRPIGRSCCTRRRRVWCCALRHRARSRPYHPGSHGCACATPPDGASCASSSSACPAATPRSACRPAGSSREAIAPTSCSATRRGRSPRRASASTRERAGSGRAVAGAAELDEILARQARVAGAVARRGAGVPGARNGRADLDREAGRDRARRAARARPAAGARHRIAALGESGSGGRTEHAGRTRPTARRRRWSSRAAASRDREPAAAGERGQEAASARGTVAVAAGVHGAAAGAAGRQAGARRIRHAADVRALLAGGTRAVADRRVSPTRLIGGNARAAEAQCRIAAALRAVGTGAAAGELSLHGTPKSPSSVHSTSRALARSWR